MSNWIIRHIATCFFSLVVLIVILAIIDSISAKEVIKKINAKADTNYVKVNSFIQYENILQRLDEIKIILNDSNKINNAHY
jgi:hypothetical protein